MKVDQASKSGFDTFMPFYLFPYLNLKHPKGRNSMSFFIISEYLALQVLDKYLLNEGGRSPLSEC